MESSPLVIPVIDTGVPIVAAAGSSHSVNCAAHAAAQRNRLSKVITIPADVLLPDQDGVIRSGFGCPLGVDGGTLRQLIAEGKLIAIGAILIGIPAAEGVAKALHLRIGSGTSRCLTGFDELRCVVGCALAVLIEHQPVACRCING